MQKIEFLQQKQEIDLLISQKNFSRCAYLAQFRSEIRPQIAALIPKNHVVDQDFSSAKAIKAKCVDCRKIYNSYNLKEELGKCDVCRAKEARELLELKSLHSIFQQRIRRKQGERRPQRSLVPWHLGEDKLYQIASFFSEEYYVKRTVKFKKDLLLIVNEKFSLNLDLEQFISLTNKNFLKKRKLVYQFS